MDFLGHREVDPAGINGEVGYSLLVPNMSAQITTQGKVFTKSRPLLGWEGHFLSYVWRMAKDINAPFKSESLTRACRGAASPAPSAAS